MAEPKKRTRTRVAGGPPTGARPAASSSARATPKAREEEPPVASGGGATADSTLEQRLEWLQRGLREIGAMCLQLGGESGGTKGLRTPPPDAAPGPPPVAAPPPPPTGDVTLKQFLEGVQDLTHEERLTVVDAAATMLGQVYVHLPLKRAMHGIDPLQRLRLLRRKLALQIKLGERDESARQFHDEMIEIFHSLRDLHTNYILPFDFQGKTAYLPFLAEEYFEGSPPRRRFLVTRVLPGFSHPTFGVGATLTSWNGIPIDRAVERNAAREAGSNADARHARGLEALTLRPMALTAPPDEEWVVIGYESGGRAFKAQFDWMVTTPAAAISGADVHDPGDMADDVARVMGYDAETEAFRRSRKSLFFPEEVDKERHMALVVASVTTPADPFAAAAPVDGPRFGASALGFDVKGEALRRMKQAMRPPDMPEAQRRMAAAAASTTGAPPSVAADATSLLPDFFAFRTVETPSGTFGYIRISSFMTFDADSFAAEFVRLAKLLPQNGLIVDVRGNGGGNINAGELLLQALTSRPIEPERFHFINSPATLRLCQGHPSLAEWVESIDLAVETGETYSQGFPLTSEARANAGLGYHYPGPVTLVVDALCYSTTDIFTAGFQDHGVGRVLGTSGRTGAGGANVWTYDFFTHLDGFIPPPRGVSFRTAIRRSTRVGARTGVPLEDLGVKPDAVHLMTRRDILERNVDLIAAAAQMLNPGTL
ncbi:S41 family peptidase [Planctomyces sp. SH-PL62]|uniref:S41 family peptidase n=1 Tax=Planctomyces sp. SH-PL62 TaxID=1636152 RepID=UPI00078C331C|nr:S41 family peptidase [Planctomyces sp. SH-PL62]AMV37742.1 Peptidase family S41 [Planctomyces sp. SH-PL62]